LLRATDVVESVIDATTQMTAFHNLLAHALSSCTPPVSYLHAAVLTIAFRQRDDARDEVRVGRTVVVPVSAGGAVWISPPAATRNPDASAVDCQLPPAISGTGRASSSLCVAYRLHDHLAMVQVQFAFVEQLQSRSGYVNLRRV
jgi:hypothetical protein